MRTILTASVVSAFVLGSAGAAIAGTTTNRITNGHSTFRSTTNVNVSEYTNKQFDNSTYNVKLDAVTDEGGTMTVRGSFINGNINLSGFATTNQNDPFLNYGEVSTSEWGTQITRTNVDTNISERGGESFIEYSLGTDTGY